jgi:hypothetical protein
VIQATDLNLVHRFFLSRLGLHWSDDFRGVLYVPDRYRGRPADMDDVAVAWAYNAFIGRTCCVHCVVQKPESLTRRMISEGFEFPFVACHCEVLLGLVDSTNKAAMEFDTRLGFRHVATVPHGGVDGDLNILQMLRSECRWLKHLLH